MKKTFIITKDGKFEVERITTHYKIENGEEIAFKLYLTADKKMYLESEITEIVEE